MSTTPSTAPDSAQHDKHRKVFRILLCVVVALLAINAFAWYRYLTSDSYTPASGSAPREIKLSFDGSSDKLRQTVFVPTLESPVPPGKSAVWCATLGLAWQELEKTALQGPMQVKRAQDIVRALTQMPDPGLKPEHYYVAAGSIRERIIERIRQELPGRFPKAPLPLCGFDATSATHIGCGEGLATGKTDIGAAWENSLHDVCESASSCVVRAKWAYNLT